MKRITKQILNAEEFWTFSLRFYGLDENQLDLLRLQDEANLNVNHCLFLFYLFNAGYTINREQCGLLDDALLESERVTEGLRIKRKQESVDKTSRSYREALETEISSEKNQQAALIRCFQTLSGVDSVTSDLSEKAKIEYFQDFMMYLSQKRNGRLMDDAGQSVSDFTFEHLRECIINCSARLVRSYLNAQPIV